MIKRQEPPDEAKRVFFVVWEDHTREEYKQMVVGHSKDFAIQALGPKVRRIINVQEL